MRGGNGWVVERGRRVGRNQAGVSASRFLQVHLKRKSGLPRLGNGPGIKYIHDRGKFREF